MYQRILVPVDGSSTAKCGILEALKLSGVAGGHVRLLHVVNELVLTGPYEPIQDLGGVITTLREAGQATLDAAQAFAKQHGGSVEPVLMEAIGGRAADRIVEYASDWPADVIVMGTHGRRGLQRLAMGSDAELVVRLAPMPVLLVKEMPER